MRVVLLGVAAALASISVPVASAQAEPLGFSGGLPTLQSDFVSGRRDGFRHDRRRHRGFDGGAFLYDREYQGDTAWRHDSYNDWWHERPHRSHPAWMSRNQNCERMYWSGGGWRC
jgi:hypothetical protein